MIEESRKNYIWKVRTLCKWQQIVLIWKLYGIVYINNQGLQIHWGKLKWISQSQGGRAVKPFVHYYKAHHRLKRKAKNWGLKIKRWSLQMPQRLTDIADEPESRHTCWEVKWACVYYFFGSDSGVRWWDITKHEVENYGRWNIKYKINSIPILSRKLFL